MLTKKFFAFILCSVVFCESSFVDTLTKCSKDDGKCQGKLITTIMHDNPHGIPEYGIPSFDPAKMTNVNVNVANAVNLTLIEGEVTGAKDCIINKFTTSIEERHSKLDLTCNIKVRGNYHVFSDSPLIKTLLGVKTVTGNGIGEVAVDKLRMIMVMPFKMVKRGGDIFLIGKKGKLTYTYDILGKVVFAAEKLYLGKEESSKIIIPIMNDNWKLIVSSYGKEFLDVAIKFIYEYTYKFFSGVPAKHYIIEDLSSYIKH